MRRSGRVFVGEASLYQPSAPAAIAILDYIERHSPQGAASVTHRLEQAIAILKLQPHIGVSTQRRGYRRFVLNPYPYVVLYQLTATTVIIHSVRHLARTRRGA